jgi:2-octaprenyl-6-methoxyphenol hydroxylase
MDKKDCDVLIVGGGLVGHSLAKGLENLGISYYLVDKPLPESSQELRALALSNTSLAILNYFGLGASLKPRLTPINQVQVSCEKALGLTVLNSKDEKPLGGVVNLIELNHLLKSSLNHPDVLLNGCFNSFAEDGRQVVTHISGQTQVFNPKIVIAADGAHSSVRQQCGLKVEKTIEQVAMLNLIRLEKPHQGLALERFTQLGPIAFLPWGLHEMVVIWCLHSKEAENISILSTKQKIALIQNQFGHRLGEISKFSELACYPLAQVFMPKQCHHHSLFLGNAAHTLHPVAGQGFNLSLRDVVILLDVLQRFGVSEKVFPMYLTQRLNDQKLTKNMTHFLAEKFNQLPKVWRGLGLGALNAMPMMKQLISHYAQGLGYPLPSWVYQQMESLYD